MYFDTRLTGKIKNNKGVMFISLKILLPLLLVSTTIVVGDYNND